MSAKILFWDNDIISKIACVNLMSEAEKVLESNSQNFRILSSLISQLKKGKKWRENYSEEQLSKIITIVKDFKNISFLNDSIESILSTKENIDAGEITLISNFLQEENALFLTGDKRCLKALFYHDELEIKEIQQKLLGKVVCFESLLLEISKTMPFEKFRAKFEPFNPIQEKTLRIVFKSDFSASQKDFNEGIKSYLENLLSETNQNLLYKF